MTEDNSREPHARSRFTARRERLYGDMWVVRDSNGDFVVSSDDLKSLERQFDNLEVRGRNWQQPRHKNSF